MVYSAVGELRPALMYSSCYVVCFNSTHGSGVRLCILEVLLLFSGYRHWSAPERSSSTACMRAPAKLCSGTFASGALGRVGEVDPYDTPQIYPYNSPPLPLKHHSP